MSCVLLSMLLSSAVPAADAPGAKMLIEIA